MRAAPKGGLSTGRFSPWPVRLIIPDRWVMAGRRQLQAWDTVSPLMSAVSVNISAAAPA
jgi:hypothetical protein